MKNWFPLYKSLMEDYREFNLLTPSEKIYLWDLISEFNLRGKFYKSDLELEVILAFSEDTKRKARCKIDNLGWVGIIPGFISKGKRPATIYLSVRYSTVNKNGDFFSKMHRYAFDSMIAGIPRRIFNHADIVIYIYLNYFYSKF